MLSGSVDLPPPLARGGWPAALPRGGRVAHLQCPAHFNGVVIETPVVVGCSCSVWDCARIWGIFRFRTVRDLVFSGCTSLLTCLSGFDYNNHWLVPGFLVAYARQRYRSCGGVCAQSVTQSLSSSSACAHSSDKGGRRRGYVPDGMGGCRGARGGLRC